LLIGLFKYRHPFSYFYLLLYTFLLFGVLFFKPNLNINYDYSILYDRIHLDPSLIPRNWLIVISILLVYIFAVLLRTILGRFNLYSDQSVIPSYIFITLSAFHPGVILLNPSSITIFITLIVVFDLCKASDMEVAVQKLFFTSFIVGIGALIYTPVAFHIIFILITLPLIKTLKFRELLIVPIGFVIPFYLTGFYFYYTDTLGIYKDLIINNLPNFNIPVNNLDLIYGVPFGFITLVFIVSYFKYRFQMISKTIRIIIYNRVLLSYVIFSILLLVFISANRMTIGYYTIAAATPFISNMLSDEKNYRFNQIIFTILLLITVFFQWINFSV
jgi:hypothetical protein